MSVVTHKKMLPDAMKAILASDDIKSFMGKKHKFSGETLSQAWEIVVRNRSYRIISRMTSFGEMWRRYRAAKEWSKVRVLLESLLQTGDVHRIYTYNDDLFPVEIQYLHTRGLFDSSLGMKNTRLDTSITYLLLSLGATLEPQERHNNMNSGELSHLYNLMIVPFSLVSSLEQLTTEMCRDVVLYDIFDNGPFLDMIPSEDEYGVPTSLDRWIVKRGELEPWMVYMLLTDDELIDPDRVLYELAVEEDKIYDYLITRGVRFSVNLSNRLIVGLNFPLED